MQMDFPHMESEGAIPVITIAGCFSLGRGDGIEPYGAYNNFD